MILVDSRALNSLVPGTAPLGCGASFRLWFHWVLSACSAMSRGVWGGFRGGSTVAGRPRGRSRRKPKDVGGFAWGREGQPLAWMLSSPYPTPHHLRGGYPGAGPGERLTGIWARTGAQGIPEVGQFRKRGGAGRARARSHGRQLRVILWRPSKTARFLSVPLLVADVSDISRFLSAFHKPHAGLIQAAQQLLSDEQAPLRQKLLADLLHTISENIAAETRAEDPPWFEGLESRFRSKSGYLRYSCESRIRSYLREVNSYASVVSVEAQEEYSRIVDIMCRELRAAQYNGSYFDRGAKAGGRLCTPEGWFCCQGPFDVDTCASKHSINPYGNRESRVLFSTWNLDHIGLPMPFKWPYRFWESDGTERIQDVPGTVKAAVPPLLGPFPSAHRSCSSETRGFRAGLWALCALPSWKTSL
uniref:DNAation factor subunit beta isoform X2 n=1 Tax=Callorhinus ursinus TaxID=34884 RepID=A0A3Q7PA47_CALUR|nr:DNA fragmentation factor subunit beta isoform X2 [Callorhinus ursinus]